MGSEAGSGHSTYYWQGPRIVSVYFFHYCVNPNFQIVNSLSKQLLRARTILKFYRTRKLPLIGWTIYLVPFGKFIV